MKFGRSHYGHKSIPDAKFESDSSSSCGDMTSQNFPRKKGTSHEMFYKHFRLAGHSVADMKVQILEKIYHSSENPVNIRLHRRLRELHWIKELGTAAPYGCNDQIKGVGTLSSPSCKHTNVLGIFNKHQRRKGSHGHRHYNKKAPQLDSSIDTMVNLIELIDQP